MRRPLVGVIGNYYLINDEYPVHASGTMNFEALSDVSGCMPVIIPADPAYVSVEELQNCFDGFVFTLIIFVRLFRNGQMQGFDGSPFLPTLIYTCVEIKSNSNNKQNMLQHKQ